MITNNDSSHESNESNIKAHHKSRMSRKCPSGQDLEDLLGIYESPQNLLLLNNR